MMKLAINKKAIHHSDNAFECSLAFVVPKLLHLPSLVEMNTTGIGYINHYIIIEERP